MTEERMICIRESRLVEFTDSDGDHIRDELIEFEWEPVEPAPPKDWRPACFSESKLHDHCNHPYFDHEESCNKCPFKKR